MTNFNQNPDSEVLDLSTKNWSWLQERLKGHSSAVLEEWFDEQLELLELTYAEFVTEKSRKRAMADELFGSRR